MDGLGGFFSCVSAWYQFKYWLNILNLHLSFVLAARSVSTGFAGRFLFGLKVQTFRHVYTHRQVVVSPHGMPHHQVTDLGTSDQARSGRMT
jgi:hypothetical protein